MGGYGMGRTMLLAMVLHGFDKDVQTVVGGCRQIYSAGAVGQEGEHHCQQ